MPIDVEKVKRLFPAGTKIKCIKMKGESSIPSGMTGIVQFIDDAGTIFPRWENGSLLGIIPDKDEFSKVT